MTKIVKVLDEMARDEMAWAEHRFGERKTHSFEGPLLAVNPTPEELSELDPIFKTIYESGRYAHLDQVEGIVYYDAGVERAFIVDEEDTSVEEVEDHA